VTGVDIKPCRARRCAKVVRVTYDYHAGIRARYNAFLLDERRAHEVGRPVPQHQAEEESDVAEGRSIDARVRKEQRG
jgi:hypothetical protein